MKKLLVFLFAFVAITASAGENDFVINQANADGFSITPRLVSIPSGGASGVLTYNSTSHWPQLAVVDSTLCISTSGILSVCTATLSGKFDTPSGTTLQYVRGDGTLATLPASGAGTVTSVTAGTGLSGGAITSSGTISMPDTGTAGTYSGVTTDTQGRVTSGTTVSQSSATRTLNSAFQISTTRGTFVFYSVQITVTASIGGSQDGDCILEIASDSGFTTNVQTVQVSPGSQAFTLAITLGSVAKGSVNVNGYVPAGYYARIRTVNNTGTPAFLYRAGQEVSM